MAVIVNGMDMPNMCGRCDMWDISSEMCRFLVQTNEDKMAIRKDCPLKSVDGLIEKIQDKMQRRDRAYRRDEISKKQLDIEFCTYAEVIGIIKEYCEVLDYGNN